uniref:TUG ubiquitin-like domain-containing protein n=1 Tax=Strigamia maritima TaxID=126957 RepID=T1J1W1_STRMM
MSARTVVVLCPNGRRQQIKVTNNSTNLQILEDVCIKQGLKSEEFDLKHYNKILDPSSTVQFSNLPNNAQLELVDITKPRKEEDVKIALQLEDGQRFIHTFASSLTLWDVLDWFRSNENWQDTDQMPVCVYMRREVRDL